MIHVSATLTHLHRAALLALLSLTSYATQAQNIHDQYRDFITNNPSNAVRQDINSYPTPPGFIGEYQFTLRPNDWFVALVAAGFSSVSDFRIETEVVSFPFIPVYNFDTFTRRTLGLPADQDMYSASEGMRIDINAYYNTGTVGSPMPVFTPQVNDYVSFKLDNGVKTTAL